MFHCQHVRGIGHLIRALALVDELKDHFDLIFLSGGKIPSNIQLPKDIEVIQLPPVEVNSYDLLISTDRRRTLKSVLRSRREKILQIFEKVRPDVLIVEFYPFGRLDFSGELLPLLEAAGNTNIKNRPLVLSSLRDILEQSHVYQATLNDLASVLCNHLFDGVLVHSDPQFSKFEDTFYSNVKITTPIIYTGFVIPNKIKTSEQNGQVSQVVVSAGGGRVGGKLLLSAVKAYTEYGIGDGVGMIVTTGPFLPENEWKTLKSVGAGVKGLKIYRWIPNLDQVLARSAASVSQYGYNTSIALLSVGIPALVVPFTGPKDKEQMRRARKMGKLGAVRVMTEDQVNPQTLAEEIKLLLNFKPKNIKIDLNGAKNTTKLIQEMLKKRKI